MAPFAAFRLAALAVASLLLGGCLLVPDRTPAGPPSMYRSLAQPGAALDLAAAQAMISTYRQTQGLGPVALDTDLVRVAQAQAQAMAAADRMSHDVAGPLRDRLGRAGYRFTGAAENIGAGYHTLAEAFSGWRGSPPHRANMLARDLTRIGIAAVYAPRSKYKVYWAMVIAEPAR